MKRAYLTIALLAGLAVAFPHVPRLTGSEPAPRAWPDEIAKVAQCRLANSEETFRQHNVELHRLFEQYVAERGGQVTADAVRGFHALLAQAGLTSFDNFCAAMVQPLRYVEDGPSRQRVPVYGPLGSDTINPWLAAVGVAEGKPLAEQPMYRLAADVLRETVDFAIVGAADPTLSFEVLPPELRENARWAYRRLNPDNVFQGGFDQPLFYATVREAAKKLFRDDFPQAKLTLADIVAPLEQGGFGIESCLMCHNRSHTDVYIRTLGQGRYHQNRAQELRLQASSVAAEAQSDGAATAHVREAETLAAMFERAADHVLVAARGNIDRQQVERALGGASAGNLARLMPGYEEFYQALDSTGCTTCHGATQRPDAAVDPARFNAFVLHPNNYFKTRNVIALAELIDFQNLEHSKLLAKAGGRLKHRGAAEVKLDSDEVEQLRQALQHWVHALDTRPPAP